VPFTREILRWLKDRGIKTGITTLTCREAVNIVFPDFHNYVDVVITRERTRQIKPNPEQIEKALATLNVVAERALMVGDHPRDILAGKAFSVKTDAVFSGTISGKAFEEAGADYIAADIRSLPEIVSELSGVQYWQTNRSFTKSGPVEQRVAEPFRGNKKIDPPLYTVLYNPYLTGRLTGRKDQ
jgi:beta-phosphoglucomutase-like phosphatase (HAD superfamily)